MQTVESPKLAEIKRHDPREITIREDWGLRVDLLELPRAKRRTREDFGLTRSPRELVAYIEGVLSEPERRRRAIMASGEYKAAVREIGIAREYMLLLMQEAGNFENEETASSVSGLGISPADICFKQVKQLWLQILPRLVFSDPRKLGTGNQRLIDQTRRKTNEEATREFEGDFRTTFARQQSDLMLEEATENFQELVEDAQTARERNAKRKKNDGGKRAKPGFVDPLTITNVFEGTEDLEDEEGDE